MTPLSEVVLDFAVETDSQRVAVAVAGLPEHLADDAAQKRDLMATRKW